GFGGHRYWLAATPYPLADNDFENPCLWVSADGWTWSVQAGVENPVEPMPPTGYWSDTHLVLHDGTLHLFFRGVNVDGTDQDEVYLRTSQDGVTWTEKVSVVGDSVATRRFLSPAVVPGEDGIWRMWVVDIVPSPYT